VAFRSVSRRDLGAGLLPARPGPATAPQLSSVWALAWRLQRSLLAGWVVAFTVGGLVIGGMVSSIPEITRKGGLAIRVLFQRFSGGDSALTADVFLWLLILTLAYTAALYPILAVLRLRDEERSGRAEALLSTGVDRLRWAGSYLLVAMTGTALIMLAGGLGVGLAHGLKSGNVSGQLPRVVLAALVQVPAAWTLGGVAMLAVGALPRLASALAWSAWMLVNLSGEVLGPILGIDYSVANRIAPFHYVPKVLTGEPLQWTPLLALSLVAAALASTGVAALRRRDMGN
jgi:ABC-2 type transport system permease protein